MKLSEFLFVLSVSCCTAWGSELEDGREADRANGVSSSNLTQILENWRYSIMAEVKDLLLQHHNTVLPYYSQIPPLSESLQSLDREVNKIRGDVEELKVTFSGFGDLLGKLGSGRNLSDTSELTATFRGLKALLKIFSTGRNQSHTSRGTGTQPQGKRKVILRRKKKPVTSTGPGTRGQTRKYVRLPRLRLPVGGAQRNFSPQKPTWRQKPHRVKHRRHLDWS